MTSAPPRAIHLRGLRTHNLKGIDLDLPLNHLIVVTGVSGSGKSSLAFDTVYAEGQRRYIETFSAYARQFLEKLDKPAADRIEGIPPAIAVSRGQGRLSDRGTVGTLTEVHDALGLLYARAGEVFCRECGQPVVPATAMTVSRAIDELAENTPYLLGYPLDLGPETNRAAVLRSLRGEGFTRIAAAGQVLRIDDSGLKLPDGVPIDVIVDRLVRGKDPRQRRTDSIESAFARGLGRCRVLVVGGESWTYTRGWRCSRCGADHIEPQPNLFRFNGALGACRACEGLGRTTKLDLGRIVPDRAKSIRAGAIAPLTAPGHRGRLQEWLDAAPAAGVPVDVPFSELAPEQVRRLLEGVPGTGFTGLDGFFQGLERRAYDPRVRLFLGQWRSQQTCSACRGARLRPEALAVRIGGLNIAELAAMTVRDARSFLAGLETLRGHPGAAGLVARAQNRLAYLGEIGLDYLALDRSARGLSRGELQRVVLTKALGSGLVNTLYVLDEPTIGLHPREVARLTTVLHQLRDRGNTLLVVEHDAEVVRASDYVVDLGPGAGEAGGHRLYAGPIAGFSSIEGSATSDFLNGRQRVAVPTARRPVTRQGLRLIGARGNNLRSIDVSFPLNVFCVVTGVSGAGKSTLIEETLYPALRHRIAGEAALAAAHDDLTGIEPLADAVFLDQSPLARSARSNPATYLKVFDEVRVTFAATHEAKLRNYDAGKFSFNVEGGRCNACQGDGYQTIDMQFLPDVVIRCPECHGTRYRPEVLEITYRGRTIAEVLDLTAREAFAFFRHRPKIQARLRPLLDIGLDYLKLGQPAWALSGGEAQRLKLASFLGRSLAALRRAAHAPHTLFLLDEPTAGLHPLDTLKLLEALGSLVDRGHSAIAITHSPAVMLSADWIIDLGPGPGVDGGQVVAEGTPEDVARSSTLTGQVLARAFQELQPGL